MARRHRNHDQTFIGAFLIGLALLFYMGYWFPGILFVVGGAMLARTVLSERRHWSTDRSALVVIATGVLFALSDVLSFLNDGVWLPIVLLALGALLLFGDQIRAKLR